jgi:FKBP-type peptidyl-prolyl cis-trans isomerase
MCHIFKPPVQETWITVVLYATVNEHNRATDTVVTHYRGALIGGQEFDSSHRRGEPVNFLVKGVIPGWTEALQLMKVGSKWQLFVPPQLAYRENGAGADIGPNATLIFELELIGVK